MEREFKGVWIPKEIWLDHNLSMLDKVILTEIDSLDNEEHCTVGNEYLSEFCNCSISKVSSSINNLKKNGYIEQISFDGRHRILKSNLCISKRQDTKKEYSAYQKEGDRVLKSGNQPTKKTKAAYQKKEAINIYNNLPINLKNNLNINNKKNIYKKEKNDPKIYETIINYLNEKTNQNYKYTTNKTKELIKARLNEGFTLSDFYKVIDNKCNDWLNTEWERYLRPITLFGAKFESYLNQPIKSKELKTSELPIDEDFREEFFKQ